jgi:hypothetical protein
MIFAERPCHVLAEPLPWVQLWFAPALFIRKRVNVVDVENQRLRPCNATNFRRKWVSAPIAFFLALQLELRYYPPGRQTQWFGNFSVFNLCLNEGKTMKDRKFVILGVALACALVGIASATVGYRMELYVWPHDDRFVGTFWHGLIAGLGAGVITALLLLATAREKMWLVALVGCGLSFVGGCTYETREIKNTMERGRQLFDSGGRN